MIPLQNYCYYYKTKNDFDDVFIIKNHPILLK
jgi:hypothetical protein